VTNLRLVSADGRHRRLLLRNGGRPAWSPDGQRIVFQRFTGSRQHLWIVNQDGSGLRRLTGASGEQYAAAWRRG
jgi:Tol biopolymer transport system component